MKPIRTIAALALFCASSQYALAQHDDDVILAVVEGQVVTGVMHDDAFEPNRIWVENIDADVTDDPGYDAPSNTFPPSTLTGISIRKALRVWTYADGHFHDIADEPLVIWRFGQSIETPPEDPQPGEFPSLPLGLTSGAGSLHVHPWYGFTEPAAYGMYLLELEFWIDGGGIATSEPFWIIFTKDEDNEGAIQQAIDWVYDNLIDPLPTCPGDLTGNGSVGVPDLLALLACWGPVEPGSGCEAADLTGSGSVGVPDLLELLAQWGPCPD